MAAVRPQTCGRRAGVVPHVSAVVRSSRTRPIKLVHRPVASNFSIHLGREVGNGLTTSLGYGTLRLSRSRRDTLLDRSRRLNCHAQASTPLAQKLKSGIQRQAEQLSRVKGQLVPMSVLFFCMAMINTFLDSAKDAMVITLSGGGAEVLPFLLPYAVFPSSVLFVVLFAWLSIRFSRRTLFNLVVLGFTSYFALFAGVLFPHRHLFEAHALADWMAGVLPAGLSGLVVMVRTWVFTTFYVISEMWGDVVLSLLFWGLANERTSVEDAHILYPLFGIGANLAQTMAGTTLRWINSGARAADYNGSIHLMMCISMALCTVILGVHHFISERRELKDAQVKPVVKPLMEETKPAQQKGDSTETKEKKKKPSLREAVGILAKSPQIMCLATMALCQGLATNLLEVTWKGHLRLLHPSPSAYTKYLGDVATFTGLATIVAMVFAPYLFTKFGWAFSASLTPVALLVCGGVFFVGAIGLGYLPANLATVVLVGLVGAGALCSITSRALKFSLFKPAEEMVYISLDKESQTTGKAAVDVMGAQMGKAIASCLQQVLLLVCGGSLFNFIPVLAVAFFFIIRKWIAAVYTLAGIHVPTPEEQESIALGVEDPHLPVDLSCPVVPVTEVDLELEEATAATAGPVKDFESAVDKS